MSVVTRELSAEDIVALAEASGLTLEQARDRLFPLPPYSAEDDQRAARNGDDEARTRLLKSASEALGMADPIYAVFKVSSDPPMYYLTFASEPSKRIPLGTIDVLDTQSKFRRRMLELLDWQPEQHKAADYNHVVVNGLAAAAFREDPDPSTTSAGKARHWVGEYLNSGRFDRVVNLRELDAEDREVRDEHLRRVELLLKPFRDERGLHVFLPAVQRVAWELSHGLEHPPAHELARCFTAAGYERVNTKFPKPNGPGLTTRSTWIVDRVDDSVYVPF